MDKIIAGLIIFFFCCSCSKQAVQPLQLLKTNESKLEINDKNVLIGINSACVSPDEKYLLLQDKKSKSLFLYDSNWHLVKVLQADSTLTAQLVPLTVDIWTGRPLLSFDSLTAAERQSFNNFRPRNSFTNGTFLSDTEIFLTGRVYAFIKDSLAKAEKTFIPCFFIYNIPSNSYSILPSKLFYGRSYMDEQSVFYLPNSKKIIASIRNNQAIRNHDYTHAVALGIFNMKGEFESVFSYLPEVAKNSQLDNAQFHASGFIDKDGSPFISYGLTPNIYTNEGRLAYTIGDLSFNNNEYFTALTKIHETTPVTPATSLPRRTHIFT